MFNPRECRVICLNLHVIKVENRWNTETFPCDGHLPQHIEYVTRTCTLNDIQARMLILPLDVAFFKQYSFLLYFAI